MKGKITIVTLVLIVVGMIGFLGGYAVITKSNQLEFAGDGYVLSSVNGGVERLGFEAGKKYSRRSDVSVTYRDTDGARVDVPSASFLHYENGGMAAFAGGILVNFADLSDNFINNYYFSGGLEIVPAGSGYTAHTAAGDIQLGDHLWKLSDTTYLVRSPSLKVVFSQSDMRDTTDFVQVSVSEDGIVSLLTNENRWDTISEECYIETATGVRVYPVAQLIDNGTYKMSVAKLSVSADDAIVLTEDETRRQIVPELNITAEDGADGVDGAAGTTGTDGATGNDGSEGESGTTGGNGTSGGTGANGSAGNAGRDAVSQTTTNSALPTMTITDWQLSAASLSGVIAITDEAGALQFDDGDSDKYYGTVTIYEVATGKAVVCYQVQPGQPAESAGSSEKFDEFRQGVDEVGFATMDNVLTPNTAYRLSVVAYYKMDDTIYSREFITRMFYTDTTGVFISKAFAEETRLGVDMRVSEAYQDSVKVVEVVLLTPEQNKRFSLVSTNYTQKYTLDYDGNSMTRTDNEGNVTTVTDKPDVTQITELIFKDLQANSDYVARVVVETKSGLKSLTEQELALKTLKTPPEKVDKDALPEANYNRVTGGFEVYRPQMKDIHGGITEYEYTVYAADGSVVQTRRVSPQDGEPMVFFLPSEAKYSFGVKAYFDDNEKQVIYDLDKTELIEAVGATLPGVTFEPEESPSSQEFNQIKGTIVINLANASSKLTIDNNKPLELQIYADQVYDQKITLNDANGTFQENTDPDKNRYTITMTQQANETRIHVDFQKLYKNTTYSATLVGYLDLGDGNGDNVKRTIGTVSFRTKDTVGLSAQWPEGTNSSSALNKVLKLVPNTLEEEVRQSYARTELQKGQLTLELYSGTGTGKVRLASSNIADADVLAEIYTGSGHLITEADFGNLKLTPNQNYTLVVTSVADETARRDDLGYVNFFDNVENSECLLVAGATPPDLVADAASGVEATPIYNADAATYGAKKDSALPDDAFIGYKLQSNYDNVQRLASSVTYYAQEYTQFYNALVKGGTDPIGRSGNDVPKLMTMTQKAAANSNSLPAVAVLFGGTKTASDAYANYINGTYVYYAGPVRANGESLESGMGRGFRYVFSYTAKYSPTGDLSDEAGMSVYPYDHADYESAKASTGAGREHGKVLGRGVAYVLNSGMCEAPRLDPTIYSYLYQVTASYKIGSSIASVTEGTAEIHYKYQDTDGTIVTEGAEGSKTQIEWESAGATNSQAINKSPVNGATDWYSVSIPYTVTGSTEQILQPRLTIKRYQLDYSVIMTDLAAGTSGEADDSETFYLCFVPVEHDYAGKFTSTGYLNAAQIQVEKHEDENYIRFNLQSGTAGASNVADELYQRAYLLQMTFTSGTTTVGPIYLPLSQDAGGSYAKMATGLLADLVGKEYTMKAALLYDTGAQGWKLTENANAQTALQFISNSRGEFGLDTYASAVSGGQSSTPSGALGNLDIKLSDIRNAVTGTNPRRKLMTMTFQENGGKKQYYVYPGRYGIDAGSGSQNVNATGRYFVPKGVGTYTLGFAETDKDSLTHMTPTVKDVEITTGSNWMSLKDTFSISGVSQADQENGKYVVHVRVYDTEDAARNLYNADKGSIDIEVDSDGKPASSKDGYMVSGTALQPGQDYWYVLYMKVNGKDTVLMDASTALVAVYPFRTIDGVSITSSGGIAYNNTGYYSKTLTMQYSVSSYVNLKAKYDIFTSSDAAENGGEALYSHAYLSENGFYDAPAPDGFVLSRTGNKMQINLKPRQQRDALKPGGTYYLKVTVHDKDGSAIGSNIWPFTIPFASSYGAYVYAPQATANSINFQVTLNDPQYSLMAPDTDKAGSFAVRFAKVDANGSMTRLLTSYDDQLFDAATPKLTFQLNSSTLKTAALNTIEPETTYKLLIYAVPDADHDGVTDQHDADWFLSNSGANLHSTLNSFWNADYSKKNDTDTLNKERTFLVAEKTQKTTSTTGLLVSDKYTLTRDSASKLRLTLSESYNVVQENGSQSFKKIAWSVDGRSNSNEPFNRSGVSQDSKRDELFKQATDNAGYAVYTYTLPADVPAGSYQVVIQLYENESDLYPYKTLSIYYEN